MRLWKAVLPVVWLSLAAISCRAADERISVLLRSMLDGGPLPTEKVFYDTVADDYVKGLSPDNVRKFLPLARTLLQDSRPEARRYGLMCFAAVTARFSDSEPLLEPYVPDLVRIADDHASPLRPGALFVLGNTAPKVSPRTLAYMVAHLGDNDNTANETAAMAWILLRAGSDSLTHDVIAFARKQNKPEVTEPILGGVRKYHTRHADALAFIGESLDNPDEWTRRRAVEAVADLPAAERSPFTAQLSRLSADPTEPDEIRSEAARALKKKE